MCLLLGSFVSCAPASKLPAVSGSRILCNDSRHPCPQPISSFATYFFIFFPMTWWTYGAVAATVVIIADRVWQRTHTKWTNEPPMLPYLVPFFGHGWQFIFRGPQGAIKAAACVVLCLVTTVWLIVYDAANVSRSGNHSLCSSLERASM
jgi:hypothetical protein